MILSTTPVFMWILAFERRALLFDLGDLGRLAPRKLLRVSDVFVTHRHMDHFAGFDQLLRLLLGREKTLDVYGPAGLIDAVEHKLKAYTWNLVEGYHGNLAFRVTEIDKAGCLASARFSGRTRFERSEAESRQSDEGLLLREPGLQVRAVAIDHGVLVLAFALEERAHINVWRNKVEAMGLSIGPWLRAFKEATLRGEPENTLIDVAWRDRQFEKPATLPLGLLKKEIMKITAGRKIVYVVDCSFTHANIEKVVRLAKGCRHPIYRSDIPRSGRGARRDTAPSDCTAGRNPCAARRSEAARDAALFPSLQRPRPLPGRRGPSSVPEWLSPQ